MAKTSRHTSMVQNLSRKLIPLTTSIALLIALLAPGTFWALAHRNLQNMVLLYAEDLAEKFQHLALEAPDLWKYQTYKFTAIAEGFHPTIDVIGFRIRDEKGRQISAHNFINKGVELGSQLTFREELHFTQGAAPIHFNDRQVGTVEVIVDDSRLMRTSTLLLCFSSLIGIALALLVYRFPVRVVRKMEGEIEELIANLVNSEEKFRSLLDNIPDVAWTSDREGNSTFLSSKTWDITGYTPAEICAADSSLWFDNIHPDDREKVTKSVENLFTKGTVFDVEYRFQRKDGEWVWLHDRATGTYERDGELYADGLFSDITEQKRLEEALKSATEFSRIVMDSIDDAISIVDISDYRIMGCNAGFLKVLGLTMEEVVGKKCYEVTHHLSKPCCPPFEICPLQETVASGNYSVAEHVHFQENGDTFYAEVSTSPLFDESGKVVRVVHVARDITVRKRTEEDVRRLNSELELKVEERTRQLIDAQEVLVRKEKLAILGQLSGSVGHELRNPLGVMSNAVYFLKMVHADGDETTKEYLNIIKQEIDNSQSIITDLLDFARTKTPQTKSVTACQLLDESINKCVIPENVDLQTDLPDTLPLLKVDPLQMGQVFQNLITNAVQAMPKGGSVRISARQVRGTKGDERGNIENLNSRPSILDPDFIEISVADTGEGISPESMKKLFQPLFTTKAKGIGLGLVVCKNLVEANSGRIDVSSKSGEETTFTVTLPTEAMWYGDRQDRTEHARDDLAHDDGRKAGAHE